MDTSEVTLNEYECNLHRTTHRTKVALNVLAWQSADRELPPSEQHAPAVATPIPAFVRNFSLKGMFLVTTASFPHRSMFWLRLNVGNKNCYAKVMIKRSVKLHMGGRPCFGYGVEFIHTPQTAEFTGLIADCLPVIRNAPPRNLEGHSHVVGWRS